MFYSTDLLGKKSPLGIIWMAAHKSGKISKGKILAVNISSICRKILEPDVPLSLRLTGILVCGSVIIYKRQVDFLCEDSTRTLVSLDFSMDASKRENQCVSFKISGAGRGEFESC